MPAGRARSAGLVSLVRRAQQGDAGAVAVLMERYHPTVLRFCRRLVGEEGDAQDLTQETLLRAHRVLPRLEEPARFGAWLCGIAVNLARSWWRRQVRAPVSLDGLAPDAAAREPALLVLLSPEQAVVEAEGARRVRAADAALPPAMGRTVALFYLEGMSYAEVAVALAVPVSTVKSRLFESRARLRLVLAPEPAVSPGAAPAAALPTRRRADPTKGGVATMTAAHVAAAPEAIIRCSFCARAAPDVRRLIAGPGGVYICDACVRKCNEIIAAEEAKPAGQEA